MSKKCTNCQAELEDSKDVNFCPFCGSKIESAGIPPYSFNTASCMPVPQMRCAWLYGIAAFIMNAVGVLSVFVFKNGESEEVQAVVGVLGLAAIIFLIVLFVWIHQWCRNINRIAQSKIINPYVLDGILLGSIIIDTVCDFKFDWGGLLVFGGILLYLDKAYKMRKINPPRCWSKALTFTYCLLGVDSLCGLLECIWGDNGMIAGYIISLPAGVWLIYSMQIAFNFVICDLEYTNKKYIESWNREVSAFNKFCIFMQILIFLALFGLWIWIYSISKFKPLLAARRGIFWGILFVSAYKTQLVKILDEEIQTVSSKGQITINKG